MAHKQCLVSDQCHVSAQYGPMCWYHWRKVSDASQQAVADAAGNPQAQAQAILIAISEVQKAGI